MNPMLSTDEVATLLGVSKATVHEIVRQGDLRAYQVGAGRAANRPWRFYREDVDAYVAAGRVQPKGVS